MPPTIRSLPQVCVLFLCASLVSVGVIYFLNAEVEARRRREHLGEMDPSTIMDNRGAEPLQIPEHHRLTSSQNPSFLSTISTSIRHQFTKFYTNFRHGLDKLSSNRRRKKRELDEMKTPEINQNQEDQPHRLRHDQRHNRDHHRNRQRHDNDHDDHDKAVIIKSSHPVKKIVLEPFTKEQCYHTDDVLLVVAITCLLNFSFVSVVWCSVRCCNRRRSGRRTWKIKKKKRRYNNKRKNKRDLSWEEMSSSDSTSCTSSTDDSDSDNPLPPVKSYSMEELRFYYG